jgi:pilus assembly protein Flp/PilA
MTPRTDDRSIINDSVRHFRSNESGATAIEYALIAAGVGAAVASTVWSLGTTLTGLYTSVAGMF